MDSIKVIEKEVLIIAEGLFMYLSEEEIKALLRNLKLKFKSYTIVFDAFSKLTAKKMKNHSSLEKTNALVKWGIDDPREIESYTENIKFLKTLYFTDENAIKLLPKNYQMLFRIAGLFKSARESHRVFIMNVSDKNKVT